MVSGSVRYTLVLVKWAPPHCLEFAFPKVHPFEVWIVGFSTAVVHVAIATVWVCFYHAQWNPAP